MSHAPTPAPPTPAPTGYSFQSDLVSSLVVFLVALPLCIGIANASGAPPSAGLITGIIGGIVVGLLAGAPLQVSGPAAGLIVLVADLHRQHPPELVGLIVLAAGLVQLAAGLLRLGQWFRAVSPAVIHGMLAGIGATILASQFHVLFDHKVEGKGWQQFAAMPATLQTTFGGADAVGHLWAGGIGIAAVMLLLLWKPLVPKTLRFVPAALVAVVLAAVFASAAGAPVAFVKLPDQLLPAVAPPPADLLMRLAEPKVAVAVFAIAFIASAETLLCATALDQLHTGPRTRYDRELSAQGVGNSLCGLLGALPMTGVIVRSAVNVEAGARSRMSAVLHGVWLLVFVAALPGLLAYIPVSALAAILVVTGLKLLDLGAIRHLWSVSRGEALIYLATLGMIVATDLLTGVLTGVGLALAKLVYTFSHLEVSLRAEPDGRRAVLHLRGAATFIRLPTLASALERVPPGAELHVDLEELDYVDHACLDLLMNWEKQHAAAGGRVVLDWDGLHGRFRRASARGSAARPAVAPAPETDGPRAAVAAAAR